MSPYPQQDQQEAYEEALQAREEARDEPWWKDLTKRRAAAMSRLCEDVETEELEEMAEVGLRLSHFKEPGYFHIKGRQKRRRQRA